MKVSSAGNMNLTPSADVPTGYRFYHETVCGYNLCSTTAAHYHCISCGYGTNELPQMVAHRDMCTNCPSGNYGRFPENRTVPPPPPPHSRAFYPSLPEQPECVNTSSYVTNSNNISCVPASSSQGTAPTTSSMSNSNPGHSYYRGIPTTQQPPLFNPLLSGQGSQPVYGTVFASPTGFSIPQGTFSPSGFHGFGQSDALWPPVGPDLHNPISGNNSSYPDNNRGRSCVEKSVSNCEGPHSCYINKRGVIGNAVGYCSTLPHITPFKTGNREVPCLQPKVGMDPQACCFGQTMVGYGQSIPQSTYKSNDQYAPCTLPPINHYMPEHNELKRTSEPCISELCESACFDSLQLAHANKTTNQICSEEAKTQVHSGKEQSRPKLLSADKTHEGPPNLQGEVSSQQGKQQHENYGNIDTYSHDIHNETCYSQPPYFFQMSQNMLYSRSYNPAKTDGSYPQQNNSIQPGSDHMQGQNQTHIQETDNSTAKSNVTCELPNTESCITGRNEPCIQKPPVSFDTDKNLHCNSSTGDGHYLNVDSHNSLDQENSSLLLEHYTRDVGSLQNESSLPDSIQLCSESSEILIEDVEVGVPSSVEETAIDSANQETSSEIIVEETEEVCDERESEERENEEVEDEEVTVSEGSVQGLKQTTCLEERSYPAVQCLICDTRCTEEHLDHNFVNIEGNLPLTSTSHVPVAKKAEEVLLSNFSTFHSNILCRKCLNLIETVDCLEVKLTSVKKELRQKYQRTSETLNSSLSKNWKNMLIEDNSICVNEVPENVNQCLAVKASNVSSWREDIAEVDRTDKAVGEATVAQEPSNMQEEVSVQSLPAAASRKQTEADTCKEQNEGMGEEETPSDEEKAKNTSTDEEDKPEKIQSAFPCDVCGKMFSDKDYLAKHYQQHTGMFNFHCELCGKGFSKRSTLVYHLKRHNNDRPFQCEQCGKRFVQNCHFQNHMKQHRGEFRQHCKYCGKGYMSLNSLQVHVRTHTGERPFICEICGKRFSVQSNLTAHITLCSGNFPFYCDVCGKGFALQTKLKVHELTHNGQYPMQCNVCGKGFIKKADLVVHAKSHAGEKSFMCEICGKGFVSMGNYNKHKFQHTGERPIKCKICGKGFTRNRLLAAHMNRHSGIKPYACDQCDKCFVDKSNLYNHRRSHAGIKPYTCTVCGKSFSQSLRNHMKTHSGDKPYMCSLCGQSFTVKSSLNKHMKSSHKKNENLVPVV